ncbi:hypothetical protein [Thermosyntropha sp.]|uniref:hypothetical protein n=1 Tax=Thermosyntropha sp. TaxID=2740820 RepID=UPI0025ECD1BA|nr:hypothetical protein [Thermosyntropha sp.]MBO8159932.1 hypothetical protein [Thermosyntropha sp.]
MQRGLQGIVLLAVLALFVGFGYYIADFLLDFYDNAGDKKPVVEIADKNNIINEDTQVIYEEVYIKCGHVTISEFPERERLNGKSPDEIKKMYPESSGYEVNFQDNTLIIRQSINGWCPAEQEKRRLKDYRGYVAVYKGPPEEEVLEKVTNIKIENLPVDERNRIRRGDYEFENENALKDALENFDEYM